MLKFYWALIAALVVSSGALRAESLNFCYDPYPPYTFGSEGLAEGGLKVDLLEAVVSQIDGLSASVTLLPWKRCQSQTRAGTFDGILPLYRNPERESYMALTDATFDEQSVFWHRSDQFPPGFQWSGDFDDLSRLRLGMLTGSFVDDAMEAAFKQHQGITRARDVSTLMELLVRGRVDLVATDAAVGRHVLETNGWRELAQSIERPITSRSSHFGLSKASGAAKYLDDFNRALEKLRQDGRIEQIFNGTN